MKIIVITTALVVLSCSALAEESMGLTFYRGTDGVVTQASTDSANAMEDLAKSNGHIDLWITLNYNYNLYPDQMTAEEIATQDAEVESGFDEILKPLIAKGDAQHPNAGPFMSGPGCAVRVTKQGLNKILKDDRLIQIVVMNMG